MHPEALKIDGSGDSYEMREAVGLGKSIHIGYKEFEILKLFMSNPNQVFSKDDIITKVWGYLSEAEDNNVEVYISFLRKKLQFLKSEVAIATVRKIGYHLIVQG